MKPTTPETVYLAEWGLSEICFLDEVLYWVAFQRPPFSWVDLDGDDFRDYGMSGYEVDCADYKLSEDECKRTGLPQDPRMSFDWAFGVKPHDTLETITAQATRGAERVGNVRLSRFMRHFARRQRTDSETNEFCWNLPGGGYRAGMTPHPTPWTDGDCHRGAGPVLP